MKKILLILLVLLFICDVSYAQKRSNHHKPLWGGGHRHRHGTRGKVSYDKYTRSIQEVVFGAGADNFLGELGGANAIGSPKFNLRDFNVPSIMPVIDLGYRYQFHRDWAVKGEVNGAVLNGNDKFTLEEFRHNRNLNFRSPLIEVGARLEYMIDWTQKGERYFRNVEGYRTYAVQLYFFGGVCGFWFDPYGKMDNGGWVKLKPLCTEGQGLIPGRDPYHNFQLGFPGGVGLRYTPGIGSKISVGIEYGARWTFTDYIDDASTTYVDNQALLAYKGSVAVQMANPCINSKPTDPLYRSTLPGQQRGDPRDKDTYMFALISVYYKIEKGNHALFKTKTKYRVNTYCPKFSK